MSACEVIALDGVCGQPAELRQRRDPDGRLLESHVCPEHWRTWLGHEEASRWSPP